MPGFLWPVVTTSGFTHASIVWPSTISDSISTPIILTLCLLSSWSNAWKILLAFRSCCLSTGFRHLRDVLWSTNLQVASKIHVVLSCSRIVDFLTYFQRFSKIESSYRIGTLFGDTIYQVVPLLEYLRILCYLYPLSSSMIIGWSIDTLGSLIQTL